MATYKLDAEQRTFHTSSGVALKLRPVNPYHLERVQMELERHKPKPPDIEIDSGKGRSYWTQNPDDPAYKQALADFQRDVGVKTMQFAFYVGVENRAPERDKLPEVVKLTLSEMPNATDKDVHYLWVTSLIESEDEFAALLNYLMGQTMVTQEGIAEAEAAFPGDG